MRKSARRYRLAALAAAAALVVPQAPLRAAPPAAGGALASDNVELLASFPDVPAIGGRMVGRYLYVTTSLGVRIYDTALAPDKIPVLVGAFPLPHWENEDVDTNGRILLVSHDSFPGPSPTLYVIDVSNPRTPLLKSRLPLPKPIGHTVTCVQGCRYAWVAGGDVIKVIDLRDPANPRFAGTFDPPGEIIHDIQVDERGVAWLSGTAGLAAYTTSNPRNPEMITNTSFPSDAFLFSFFAITHNSLRPDARAWRARRAGDFANVVRRGELVIATRENFLPPFNDACNQEGEFMTAAYRRVGTRDYLSPLGRWRVGQGTIPTAQPQPAVCSSHYFSERDGVVAVAWYEQGVRFLDVSNPRRIRQIGYYMPVASAVWSTVWNGNVIYTLDAVRGIDVIRFNGRAGAASVRAPRFGAAVPGWAPSERWGWACRVRVPSAG